MNDEKWIQQMRQKMADYKRPAPEVSWDEIDRALAASKTRSVRLLWMRRMAAAAFVLLIAGVGYWSFLPDETEQVIESPIAQDLPTKNHGKENHGERLRVGDQRPGIWHNDSSAANIRVPVPVILPRKTSEVAYLDSESETVLPSSTSKSDTVNTAEPVSKEQPHAVEEKAKPAESTRRVIYPADLHQGKHLDNRLTAKVYMSSTMADRQNESFSLHIVDNKNFVHSIQIDHHVYHHQPVRFGFSLRYRLDDRWSLETGLSYTHLSSDITTIVDGVTTMTEQKLNYIGLPMNISYNLWKSNHFGLYVTTGFTIEKSLDTSPWQFSLNGAVGAEYKLTDIFSLYTEPGLGYYFKDGSTTSTIYQDRPLNFNLSIGIRFNLK
jgi:hypothetical protein